MADVKATIDCTVGTTVLTPLSPAEQTALDAFRTAQSPVLAQGQQVQANVATIRQNVTTNFATLQTWLANNPNGAVLTAGQTKVLANILIGITKLLLADTANTTGT